MNSPVSLHMKRTGTLYLLLLFLPLTLAEPFRPGPARGAEIAVRVNLNGLVRELPLEDYVGGVVFAEVGPGWPEEALKAMAVCARTFALNRVAADPGRPYHLYATVADQVYREGYRDHPAIVDAVNATRGEVLTYRDELAAVFYHAHSGGATASSESVWGGFFPHLEGKVDPYSRRAGRYNDWTMEIDAACFLEKIGPDRGRLESVAVGERSRCRRAGNVVLELSGGRRLEITARRLREEIFGGETLRSTLFSVALEHGRVVFRGSGYGHGVGLSQWGSRQMAEEGYSYRDILRFYFPGTGLHVAKLK